METLKHPKTNFYRYASIRRFSSVISANARNIDRRGENRMCDESRIVKNATAFYDPST